MKEKLFWRHWACWQIDYQMMMLWAASQNWYSCFHPTLNRRINLCFEAGKCWKAGLKDEVWIEISLGQKINSALWDELLAINLERWSYWSWYRYISQASPIDYTLKTPDLYYFHTCPQNQPAGIMPSNEFTLTLWPLGTRSDDPRMISQKTNTVKCPGCKY